MAPLFSSGEATKDVEFSWTPMANAVGYRLRISRNPYFSSTLVDKKVNTAAVTVTNLGEGAYYWMVQSYDAAGKESVESEKNRFTIISKGKETEAIDLELDPFIQHGHVIEVTGKTQIGARVMVNGSEVPMVSFDGAVSLLHAAASDREKRDYGNRPDGAGRGEHAAEEDHDSVEFRGAFTRFRRGAASTSGSSRVGGHPVE